MELGTKARPLALTSRYLRHGARHHDSERIVVECSFARASVLRMSATKILWGPILVVILIVVTTTWVATQWTAWRLGFQPQLGEAWIRVAGVPLYAPPSSIPSFSGVLSNKRIKKVENLSEKNRNPPIDGEDRHERPERVEYWLTV